MLSRGSLGCRTEKAKVWFAVHDVGNEGPEAVCGGGRPGGGLGTSTGEAKGPREKRGSRPHPAPRGRSAWGRPALGRGRRGTCPHTDALCSVRQRVPRAGRAVVLVRFGLQLCSAAVLCREPPATVGSEGAHVCDVRVGGDGAAASAPLGSAWRTSGSRSSAAGPGSTWDKPPSQEWGPTALMGSGRGPRRLHGARGPQAPAGPSPRGRGPAAGTATRSATACLPSCGTWLSRGDTPSKLGFGAQQHCRPRLLAADSR